MSMVYEYAYNQATSTTLGRLKLVLRNKVFIRTSLRLGWNLFLAIAIRTSHALSKKNLEVGKQSINYFIKPRNPIVFLRLDLNNERIVEIPYALNFLAKNGYENVMEVGNVLSKYFSFPHTIVDKYETQDGVLNIDILDFSPERKFDLIVSISTLEHVGFDELDKDPKKPAKALEKMYDLLSYGGKILISVPVNYNGAVDNILKDCPFENNQVEYIRRISLLNYWEETTQEQAFACPYNGKFPYANAVAFMIIKR